MEKIKIKFISTTLAVKVRDKQCRNTGITVSLITKGPTAHLGHGNDFSYVSGRSMADQFWTFYSFIVSIK